MAKCIVSCGVAKQLSPKLPQIQEPVKKKSNDLSYNNAGILDFLGWKK